MKTKRQNEHKHHEMDEEDQASLVKKNGKTDTLTVHAGGTTGEACSIFTLANAATNSCLLDRSSNQNRNSEHQDRNEEGTIDTGEERINSDNEEKQAGTHSSTKISLFSILVHCDLCVEMMLFISVKTPLLLLLSFCVIVVVSFYVQLSLPLSSSQNDYAVLLLVVSFYVQMSLLLSSSQTDYATLTLTQQ